MDILLVMCIGVLVGNRFFPDKYKKVNEKLQVLCTVLLIFCMGVTLGSRENFLQELGTLGGTSFLFFVIPAGFSLILVFLLTKKFMPEKKADPKEKTNPSVSMIDTESME